MGEIDNLLGLARRAGKVQSGEFCTEKSVKSRRSSLVIIATDASAGTQKQFINMADHYHVPYILYGTKESLGHSLGASIRSSLSVEDEGFAKAMKAKLS